MSILCSQRIFTNSISKNVGGGACPRKSTGSGEPLTLAFLQYYSRTRVEILQRESHLGRYNIQNPLESL